MLQLVCYIDFIGQVRGKNDAMYEKMKEKLDFF
jgi:hypothetical protein